MNGSHVKAMLVEDIDDNDSLPAGSYEFFTDFHGKIAGMLFKCPGCKSLRSLEFKPAPSPSWEWDGNTDKPTLIPSIDCKYETSNGMMTHWHGFLTAGEWKRC